MRSESFDVANGISSSVEDEIVLLEESIEFFGFASVVVSDLQGGLDTNVSNIYRGDALDASDVLCDLDRVKITTSGADDGGCLIRSELGARDEGVKRGEDSVGGNGEGVRCVGGDLTRFDWSIWSCLTAAPSLCDCVQTKHDPSPIIVSSGPRT